MPQPLDFRWVERIFARMQVRYGSRWLALWAGVEPGAVQADWSRELAGLTGEAIAYGLEHLPEDHPPTVAQFKRLCLNAPRTAEMLPPPKLDREGLAKVGLVLQTVADGLKSQQRRHPKQWAFDLQAREAAGERLSTVQRRFWREALADSDQAVITEMKPVPPELFPPQMRRDMGIDEPAQEAA